MNLLDLFKRPKFQVAIIIPLYKSQLTTYEEISLVQCTKVLGEYPIHIVCPEDLVFDLSTLPFTRNITVTRFSPRFFESRMGYNRLLLSIEFYRRFLNYKYILIYQLDAFVFQDELSYWCSQGFDYIGAPWIRDSSENRPRKRKFTKLSPRGLWVYLFEKDIPIGNGGFSLRKVKTCLLTLLLGRSKATEWSRNEDLFWSYYAPTIYPLFSFPAPEIASRFSFETHPREIYEKNQHTLPFGCHGWWKYDVAFWRQVFRNYGYAI